MICFTQIFYIIISDLTVGYVWRIQYTQDRTQKQWTINRVDMNDENIGKSHEFGQYTLYNVLVEPAMLAGYLWLAQVKLYQPLWVLRDAVPLLMDMRWEKDVPQVIYRYIIYAWIA